MKRIIGNNLCIIQNFRTLKYFETIPVLGASLDFFFVAFLSLYGSLDHPNQVANRPSLCYDSLWVGEHATHSKHLLHFTLQVIYVGQTLHIHHLANGRKHKRVHFHIAHVSFDCGVGGLVQLGIEVDQQIVTSSQSLSDLWNVIPYQCQSLSTSLFLLSLWRANSFGNCGWWDFFGHPCLESATKPFGFLSQNHAAGRACEQ